MADFLFSLHSSASAVGETWQGFQRLYHLPVFPEVLYGLGLDWQPVGLD